MRKKIKFLTTLLLFLFTLSSLGSDYYWVGGTGNFSDYSNHWSTTSGGVIFHTQQPDSSDNVIFDSNSFNNVNDTVYFNNDIKINNMDWSLIDDSVIFYHAPYNYYNIQLSGSLILSPLLHWNNSTSIYFTSNQPGNVINTNNCSLHEPPFNSAFVFNGNGSWFLLNPVKVGLIKLANGQFHTNNFNIESELRNIAFQDSAFELYLGTSQINGSIYLNGTTNIIDADSCTIICNVLIANSVDFYHVSAITVNASQCQFDSLSFQKFTGNSNSAKIALANTPFCNPFGYYSCYSLSGYQNSFQNLTIPISYFAYTGNNTFDTLTLSKPGQTFLMYTDTLNVNILNIITDCNNITSFYAENDTAVININSGNFVFQNLHILNVKRNGAASITSTNSIGEGEVSGWNITAPLPRTLYWVNGQGNWSDSSHWSLQSGGTGGACTPTISDSIYFDAQSFININDTVFADQQLIHCKYMDWSAINTSPVFYSSLQYIRFNISGSAITHPNLTWNFDGFLTVSSDSTNNIIKLPHNTVFGSGRTTYLRLHGHGSWDLQSDLNFASISLLSGTLYTHGFDLDANISIGSAGEHTAIYLDTSTINSYWLLNADGKTLVDGDSATFNCNILSLDTAYYNIVNAYNVESNYGTFGNLNTLNFKGDNNVVHRALFYTNSSNAIPSVIDGTANTFHYAEFKMNDIRFIKSGGVFNIDTLIFSPLVSYINSIFTTTFNIKDSLYLNGTCSKFTSVTANNGYIGFNMINKPANCQYLVLYNARRLGMFPCYCTNAVDYGNNIGWTLTTIPPRSLFWVGGQGNWHDNSHWSASSGGSGGACVPNKYDSLFFDSNSFTSINDTVFLSNVQDLHSLDCSAVTNSPVFKSVDYFPSHLQIFGSVNLSPAMEMKPVFFNFLSNNYGNTINTNGLNLYTAPNASYFGFDGSGSWSLNSDLNIYNIYVTNGTFISNSFDMTFDEMQITTQNDSINIQLGESNITCNNFESYSGYILIDADSCTINANLLTTDSYPIQFNKVYSAGVRSDNCHYNFLQTSGLTGSNNTIDNLEIPTAPGMLWGYNNYKNAVISSNEIKIYTGSTFDTLSFNNPGQSIIIHNGSTISISSSLNILSSPLNYTKLIGYGNNGIISKSSDTVCVDYLDISNITTTGGATFYAGSNSIDNGNNFGWNFTGCFPTTDNVWPGDANYDLIVNNQDLLYIGLAYNDTGYIRPNATLNYAPQPCTDWYYQFANTTNLKHADCDGNGIVLSNDTLAVSQNYGQSHPLRIPESELIFNSGTSLNFSLPNINYNAGDTALIPVLLGNSNDTATDLYGMAFTIHYNNSYIQSGTVKLDFNNSIIGDSGNILSIYKDLPAELKIECAATRINKTDTSCFGTVGILKFVTASSFNAQQLPLSFSNVKAISHLENTLPITYLNSPAAIIENENSPLFKIIPNPMQDRAILTFTSPINEPAYINITDLSGRIIRSYFIENDNPIFIEKGVLTSGLYIVNLSGNKVNNKFYQKLVIQ